MIKCHHCQDMGIVTNQVAMGEEPLDGKGPIKIYWVAIKGYCFCSAGRSAREHAWKMKDLLDLIRANALSWG